MFTASLTVLPSLALSAAKHHPGGGASIAWLWWPVIVVGAAVAAYYSGSSRYRALAAETGEKLRQAEDENALHQRIPRYHNQRIYQVVARLAAGPPEHKQALKEAMDSLERDSAAPNGEGNAEPPSTPASYEP